MFGYGDNGLELAAKDHIKWGRVDFYFGGGAILFLVDLTPFAVGVLVGVVFDSLDGGFDIEFECGDSLGVVILGVSLYQGIDLRGVQLFDGSQKLFIKCIKVVPQKLFCVFLLSPFQVGKFVEFSQVGVERFGRYCPLGGVLELVEEGYRCI